MPTLEEAISTDANYPISIGIPAITLGAGGEAGGAHSLDEWFDPTDAHLRTAASIFDHSWLKWYCSYDFAIITEEIIWIQLRILYLD